MRIELNYGYIEVEDKRYYMEYTIPRYGTNYYRGWIDDPVWGISYIISLLEKWAKRHEEQYRMYKSLADYVKAGGYVAECRTGAWFKAMSPEEASGLCVWQGGFVRFIPAEEFEQIANECLEAVYKIREDVEKLRQYFFPAPAPEIVVEEKIPHTPVIGVVPVVEVAPMPVPVPEEVTEGVIYIEVDKEEVIGGEVLTIYGYADPLEDIDVEVYVNGSRRAIYTIYLKTLNKNYTMIRPSQLCTDCVLELRGYGKETRRVTNTIRVHVVAFPPEEAPPTPIPPPPPIPPEIEVPPAPPEEVAPPTPAGWVIPLLLLLLAVSE